MYIWHIKVGRRRKNIQKWIHFLVSKVGRIRFSIISIFTWPAPFTGYFLKKTMDCFFDQNKKLLMNFVLIFCSRSYLYLSSFHYFFYLGISLFEGCNKKNLEGYIKKVHSWECPVQNSATWVLLRARSNL